MKRESGSGRLDVMAFASAGLELSGESPLATWGRLVLEAQGPVAGLLVSWRVRGELRTPTGGQPQAWLHLKAGASVPQTCQRCLGGMQAELSVDHHFRFVATEELAAAEDDESEEDLLVLSRRFDLPELIEDELLMAVPLIPMHEICPAPVKLAVADPEFEQALEERPNSFAILGQLKKPPARH